MELSIPPSNTMPKLLVVLLVTRLYAWINIFIYISVILVKSESVLLLVFVKYTLWPLYLKLFFLYFLEAKNPCFLTKNYSKSCYICVLIFSKNRTIDSGKTSITREWLVVESCPTLRWITFLLLYRLGYNIPSSLTKYTQN